MNGYKLSPRAAETERRWEQSREQKGVDLSHPMPLVSRQDGVNFRTNMVTLADYEDGGCGNVMGLAAVWACVNLLAGTIGSLPLMVYRQTGPRRDVAKDHWAYRLLHDSPNYDQTAVDFLEFIAGSIELQGNAYARKEMTSGKRAVALVPIRPDIVTVRRQADGSLLYQWTDDGKAWSVEQDEMIHIRGFGGGPMGGASALSVCRASFSAAMATDRAAAGVFRNGARPSGVLSVEDKLDGPRRNLLEDLLQEKFVGAMNAGRPMLLDNKMSWTQLTMNPVDAQMLESRRFSVEEICRIFGIPPHMIGHSEKSTSWGTGLEQQTLGFQKFTLRRRLKRIEQALEKQLLTAADRAAGITIEFNIEGLLRGDSAARAASYGAGLNNGYYTINEVRAWENLPPVEGGDVPRMQSQNVPITQAPAQPILPNP